MMDISGQKIVVLKGGPGSEREVSLKTAESVSEALRSLNAVIEEIDVKDAAFIVPADALIAFNTIHGTFGEDGQLQALLEERGVRYTGAGVLTSQIAFDKALTKKRFVDAGVLTPRSQNYRLDGSEPLQLALPIVVKPPREGSSVGVHIVRTDEELAVALADAKQFGEETLVEELIEGKELTIGVLGDQVLPVIHIEPADGFYDISNKYPWLTGKGKTFYHCPADLDEATAQAVQTMALAAFRAAGTEVYGRVDCLLTAAGDPYILEINTIPGMTSTSLLPKAALAAGITFPQLCLRIIELSLAARP